MSEEIIIISSSGSQFGELDTYYRTDKPIIWDRKSYSTVEHLYNARKYIFHGAPARHLEYAEEIRISNTPQQAKLLGEKSISSKRDISPVHHRRRLSSSSEEESSSNINFKTKLSINRIIKKYDDVKCDLVQLEQRNYYIMYDSTRCKIIQDAWCKEVLLSTGCKYILKLGHPYWGMMPDGTGENMLGRILMQVRDELISTEKLNS